MEENIPEKSLTDLPKGYTYPDVSDMPYEIDYVLVIPKAEENLQKNGLMPYVLTFKGEDTTFQVLMNRYIQSTKYSEPSAKYYYFSTAGDYKIDPMHEVKDFRKTIQKDKLNGVVLFVQGSDQLYDGDQYANECCVIDFLNEQKPQAEQMSKFYLRVEIMLQGCKNTEVVYVDCKLSSGGEEVVNQLFKQISNQFGIKYSNWDLIIEIYIVDPKNDKNQIKFYRHEPLSVQKVYSGTTIFVKLSNPEKRELKRINQKKYNSFIVIYKENESQPVRLKYDDVANMTFIDLYKNKLQIKSSSKKKEAVYCLKIMDKIIKPEEKLISAEIYFVNKDPTKALNVVGKIVNEKMIFWKVIPNLTAAKNSEFKLDEIVIPPTQQSQRKNCETAIKDRALRATHQYFKNTANVEPIVIYTSQLCYHDKQTNKQAVIYQSLNLFLRETRILSLDETKYSKEWKLRYASTLLKHLKNTAIHKGEAWRGISYDPSISQSDKNHIFTFKQFTSTSVFKNTAISFAKKHAKQQPYHLFALTLNSGRSVIDYSLYKEGEVIVEPFTEFECMNIKQETFGGKKFKVYFLQQRQTSKELPGTKANFVIWIDDKPEQAQLTYKKIKMPKQTTVFKIIKSTEQLAQCLEEHKQLFLDDSANFIFITNMTRKEKNDLNGTAGIDGANLIRKYSKTSPIYFYIGNILATQTKLKASNLNLDYIKVGNKPSDIESYLKAAI